LDEGLGMNISAAVNQWNPHHILDAGNVLIRSGVLILNQPINIPRDFMLSLWNKGKCKLSIAVDLVRNVLQMTRIVNLS
jgi:hypothetical protein